MASTVYIYRNREGRVKFLKGASLEKGGEFRRRPISCHTGHSANSNNPENQVSNSKTLRPTTFRKGQLTRINCLYCALISINSKTSCLLY